ncbi:UNVERIFIED_CONTAM: hypothetical protein PYX00_011803 [Menopon gallinae]|uniref:DnaJ homolog subfamily B member 9 n=1 Tax=Menopon gallinae TaxID=328185 RepID=A0AAW2H8H2_9NEOP
MARNGPPRDRERRSRYDYNKERRCVCCTVSESAVLGCSDVDGMMCALGFRKQKTLSVDGLLYTRSGVCLEIAKTCAAEGGGSRTAEWLLVLSARAPTAAAGERLVLEASDSMRPHLAPAETHPRAMEEASKHLEQRNYRRYFECVQQMYRQEETPENRDLYNCARRMYESYQAVLEFKKKDTGDLYGLLGVSPDATQDEIKHAYRRLVLAFHPDRSLIPESGEVLQVVLDAYSTLADADRRARYDRDRARSVSGETRPGSCLHDAGPFAFYRHHCYSWALDDELGMHDFIRSMEEAFRVRNLYRRRAHRAPPDIPDAGYIKTLLAFLLLVLIISILS